MTSTTRPGASRSIFVSAARGASRRCPACGKGSLYAASLAVHDRCPACGEALHHHRSDDMAPYLALFLSLHVVVPLAFLAATLWALPVWGHAVILAPLAIGLTLLALPAVKGAIVGVQWALRQYGFACETVRTSTPDRSPSRARNTQA